MTMVIREIPATLPCGRRARQGSQHGLVPGGKADQAGTLSAPSWLGRCGLQPGTVMRLSVVAVTFWERGQIFTQEELT